mgnify:FL=1
MNMELNMNKKMNMKITIEKLKSGYIITDEDNEQYAVWFLEQIVTKIKELLQIEPKPVKRKSKEGVIHDTPHDSTPELKLEPTAQPTARQKIKELSLMKDETGLLIRRFKYDPKQKKEIAGYANMSVVELEDGRAAIIYKGTHYYTTKEKVMQIPYPVPRKFLNGLGLSSIARTCLSAYRQYLFKAESTDDSGSIDFRENEKKMKEEKGNEQGTCDDIMFDSCANNSPKNCKFCVNKSRYENKNKLEAKKPAPPLMKAAMGV